MAEIRYAKLNCNWDESEWIDPMSDGAKLAWVHLITYVKAFGFGGKAKTKPAALFARQKGMRPESFEEMMAAAKVHGALIEKDGLWSLTGWKKHQGDTTNGERQARFKEAHSESNALLSEKGEASQVQGEQGNALLSKSNGEGNARREESIGEESNPLIDTGKPVQDEPAPGGTGEMDAQEQLRLNAEAEEAENAERWRVYEFWHRAAQSQDAVLAAWCNAAFRVKKFKSVAPTDFGIVERTLARIRAESPGDHAILREIELWRDYYLAKKGIRGAGQWWRTFESWCGKEYGNWDRAKKRGGLMAVDGGKKEPEKTPEQIEQETQERRARLVR